MANSAGNNIQASIGAGDAATSDNDPCDGKGEEGEKYKGGKHRNMARGGKKRGTESHHIPAHSKTDSPQSRGLSPSIQMTVPDHQKTKTWGKKAGADAYRASQRKLMRQGKKGFKKAINKEIKAIRKEFGNKYDSAIKQMLAYLECKGYI